MKYDVTIVGCGPAGIFSALELASRTDLEILMVDMGPQLEDRRCSSDRGLGCVRCEPCYLLTGWGGAGAFSDGKLTLSTEVGGWLAEYIDASELNRLIDYVDNVYVKFGAPQHLYGTDLSKIEKIERKAALAGLKLIPSKIRHLGTENCSQILSRTKQFLQGRAEIRTGTEVKSLIVKDGEIKGVETRDGEKISSRYVIVAPGRVGAEWLATEAQMLGLRALNNPVDLGVRVEVPAAVLEELTEALYEPKFIYHSKSFDDMVRTFCMNPSGEVITESYNDIVTVNGQSYAEKKTGNSNFAVLVSTKFTEPFREPIAYGKYIARLANLLGGGILVQRLGDLEAGRRSTEGRMARNLVVPTLKFATPGDLSFILPYRYLEDIKEMLQAMDKVSPGVYAKHTLLYGVEVKFYSSRLELNNDLETRIRNLFATGDGAGITRGLVQASASGVVAARAIEKKERLRD
ncbi:NAD(P)/FAD-dependent oxidoreductase [Candidatus Bathyarchaeota archaeon]|nr:NAD(P)/FAD-dependent oxidoreductase [Candidatus Bathyarchaeota archaeon]